MVAALARIPSHPLAAGSATPLPGFARRALAGHRRRDERDDLVVTANTA
jgi:hypothetical protein